MHIFQIWWASFVVHSIVVHNKCVLFLVLIVIQVNFAQVPCKGDCDYDVSITNRQWGRGGVTVTTDLGLGPGRSEEIHQPLISDLLLTEQCVRNRVCVSACTRERMYIHEYIHIYVNLYIPPHTFFLSVLRFEYPT